MNRSDIDALAEQWTNGNRAAVIAALSALDGPFSALAGAYLYHEMPDDWHRGVFARMLHRACDDLLPESSAERFIVICRDDRATEDAAPGPYVLATRRTFSDETTARKYAEGINASRAPLVVSGRFGGLR